jgi:CheY-like chemotaxis protein
MRILIVDDDSTFRDLLEMSLEENGFNDLVQASSADVVLEFLDNEDPYFDCFVLDIEMPGTDGIKLCSEIRSRPAFRLAPIIMLTSSDSKRAMWQAFNAGATDFLHKPLNSLELAARIKTASLLVESLRRETAPVLSVYENPDFDGELNGFHPGTRITFSKIRPMRDYFELENTFLRMDEALYAFSLFTVELKGFKALADNADHHEALHLVHMAASTIPRVLMSQRLLFSYIGYGKFTCALMARTPVVAQLLQARLREQLEFHVNARPSLHWESDALAVTLLSNRRIMAPSEAVRLLRQETKELTWIIHDTCMIGRETMFCARVP